MGALLTRARYRYLQREFVRADEQGRGSLMPEEVYALVVKFGVQTMTVEEISENMDLYTFINFLESHAKQVFVYTDSDEDGMISVQETTSTYAALGIMGVTEHKVIMELKRIQYQNPELINTDDIITPSFHVTFDVGMVGLVEFFFTSSVREAVTASLPHRSLDSYSLRDPALRYKTYCVGFRSKITRFPDVPSTLGPGEYESVVSAINIHDPSRASSSFKSSPRKHIKNDVEVGPGDYDPGYKACTTKRHTLSFASNSPRIVTSLPGDTEYRTKTEPLIGPGSYDAINSRAQTFPNNGVCVFPKSNRFINQFGPLPSSGDLGPGEYEIIDLKSQSHNGTMKNSQLYDTKSSHGHAPTLPTLNLPSKTPRDYGPKSARQPLRSSRSVSTPRANTARS